ncbi:uncharacterized protein KY384_001221 [Bacidia gigantensis]|uniref:uncharacterized protein n=1 Tax=Bacidia gigantensis TaxID=2732470 RepID=UPI001D038FF7|nr:uncharacterized protein KY384_001221 [Bacidia gigantensis]KAG8534376.1 hypothetical protein KY384_001221 [Bacidia gigantensis]
MARLLTQNTDVDPKNGMTSCCPADTFWRTDVDYPNEGQCCPRGTGYSFDFSIQKGKCCGPGQLFIGSACRSAPMSVKPLDTSQGPCPSCGNGPVCSYYGNLGLRYNHCYLMKDSGGNEIRQNGGFYVNQDLVVNGERSIPFRICANSTNCSVNKDNYVPEGGFWFQLDEQGPSGNPNGQPGWVVFSTDWLSVATVVPPAPGLPGPTPTNFTGVGTCTFGECAICIKFGAPGGYLGYLGLASLGGGAGTGPIAVANNRSCRAWHYEETNCIGPSIVAPN